MKKLDHPMPGWMSVVDWTNYYKFKYNLFKDSRRYESAQRNLLGLCGLTEALRLVDELASQGSRNAYSNNRLSLRPPGRERLRIFSSRRDGEKSGIVSFLVKGRVREGERVAPPEGDYRFRARRETAGVAPLLQLAGGSRPVCQGPAPLVPVRVGHPAY